MPATSAQAHPPPSDARRWTGGLNDGVFEGCLGPGSAERPVLVFGDASGGPDSVPPRARRVGLGLATFCDGGRLEAQCTVSGSLPGSQQTVPR
eukprot:1288580-Pyramimonas_sp.AAC.1